MQNLIKGEKFEKATEGELYTLPDFIKQVDEKLYHLSLVILPR